MNISQQRIKSIRIEKLKQLENVICNFEGNNLTAILGINGCGKSTILHALACCYQPATDKGENHKFSEYFLPSNYNTWDGSSFSIKYSFRERGIEKNDNDRKYKKTADRWTRYVNRPKRDVFYIGIGSCVPDIEKEKGKSKINIVREAENAVLQTIMDKVSHILSGLYQNCYNGIRNKKKYKIIKRNNIEYPSIAMGAGEQRLLNILEIVYSAPKYALILIYELDLTLHTLALDRLLNVLNKEANRKELQIIFTTHRESITKRTDINIRHLFHTNNKTFCFEGVNNACIDAITGGSSKPIKIYCEDKLSKSIISHIAKGLKIQRFCDINTFGDLQNGFTVASVKAVENIDIENILIVLDGDKCISLEEKKDALNKRFSGNTQYENEIRARALTLIKEYNNPEHKSPDRFIVDTIKDLDRESEVYDIIEQLGELRDDHNYISAIAEKLGIDNRTAGEELIREIKESQEWENYIHPIKEWLESRKQNLNLEIPN
jgi:AAA15 family ATPase/GTPase